jgi:hypothetical protein
MTDVTERHAIAHRIAGKTGACVKSVNKVLDGGTVRGQVGARIQKEVAKITAPVAPAGKAKVKK